MGGTQGCGSEYLSEYEYLLIEYIALSDRYSLTHVSSYVSSEWVVSKMPWVVSILMSTGVVVRLRLQKAV